MALLKFGCWVNINTLENSCGCYDSTTRVLSVHLYGVVCTVQHESNTKRMLRFIERHYSAIE